MLAIKPVWNFKIDKATRKITHNSHLLLFIIIGRNTIVVRPQKWVIESRQFSPKLLQKPRTITNTVSFTCVQTTVIWFAKWVR